MRTPGRLKKDAKIELLKRVPLFEGLSKAQLTHIARIADEVDFHAGKQLITEGRLGREFFVVVDGELEVRRKKRSIAKLGTGDFFGEIALVADVPRTADVIALTSVVLLVITDGAFRRLLRDEPGIAQKVMASLGTRLAETTTV